jgi:signal transduction histidine kinase
MRAAFAQLPLKRRVAALAGSLGLLLCLAFAVLAWFIAEDYEHLLVTAVLEAEAESVREDLAAGRAPRLPQGPRLRAWLFAAEAPPPMPDPSWARLPAGVHEPDDASRDGLHLAVFELDDRRLLYAMDLNEIEALERYLIGFSLLVLLAGGGLSALCAQWLAGRALRPVNSLAAAVEALPVQPQATQLAADLPEDALAGLARAIDGYQQRLLEAGEAERAFFADASHELRSPVASLRGAAEVLLDDPELSPRLRTRLARIDRASAELGQLLGGLLLTARGEPPVSEPIDLAVELADACAALAQRADERGVRLRLGPAAARPIALPKRWLQSLLQNLLRALIDSAGVRGIEVSLSEDTLELALEGEVAGSDARSDQGFPLRLTERLGRQLGLRLEHDHDAVRLHLPPADPPRQA